MGEERPRILLTGATGFVGRATLAALVARGLPVRAVTRRAGIPAGSGPAVEWRRGDLLRGEGWEALLDGVGAVVHLAGNPGIGDEAAMTRLNAGATAMLARAASGAGVGRFVLVSSVRVHGRQPLVDAATPPAPADAYGRSRLAGEEALAAAAGAMAYSVLRPPFVFGADRAGLFSLLARAARHRIPLPLGGLANRRSLVFSGNLADLVATAALEPPAAGSYRLPAAEDFDPTYGELFRAMAAAMGRKGRTFSPPAAPLRLAARLALPADAARRVFEDCVVDGSVLRERLAWTPPSRPEAALRSILIAS